MDEAEKESVKVLRREIEANKKEEAKEKAYRAREKKLHGKKLLIAQEIFEWGKKFRGTAEWPRLLKIFDDDKAEIYGAGWGHKNNGDNYGCWSRFSLKEDGTFSYIAGYKWHGVATSLTLRTAQELADKINFDYLSQVALHISSNRVNEELIGKVEKQKMRIKLGFK